MSVSVVIAGGGTGGHVYPGIALAEAILEREPAARICFAGTERGIETRVVPAAGFELETIEVLPWARTLGTRRYLAPATALRAAAQASAILRRRRVHAVASMGGYASLPVAFAARAAATPIVLHEQNVVPGRANRLTARMTRRVAVTFAESARYFPGRVRVVGNPIRASIARMDRGALRSEAMRELGLDARRRTVLVVGGSQGARRLNDAAIPLVESLAGRDDVQMLLVTGPGNDVPAKPPVLLVEAFVDRMELAYAAADCVIARAGAGLMEVAAAGVPAILVPYPFARDDHQAANARAYAASGAAVVVGDDEATGERLAAEAIAILDDADRRARMAAAARAFAKPDAAGVLADWVLEAARRTR